jgi:predicted ATPase
MTISRFGFEEISPAWKLNEVSFSDFNLLVGQSGVGKTKILNALRKVCQAGVGDAEKADDCEWRIELGITGEVYVWQARTIKFAKAEGGFETHFIKEKIIHNGVEIVQRDLPAGEFLFKKSPLPKLNGTQSAISLLQEEDGIASLNQALTEVIFSVASELKATLWYRESDSDPIEKLRDKCADFAALRKMTGIALLVRAWILQTKFPDEFERLRTIYTAIFPTVSNVRVVALKENLSAFIGGNLTTSTLVLEIEEAGVGRVSGSYISSGMARTFLHLAEITLAPSNAVIVVDELENSLGVNCLPQVTEHFLRRTDLQFILTSHHPYVINNIPWRCWKLVMREGAEVTVRDATSIPALNSASSLERFTQLLNLEEYEEAIR